MTPYPIFVILIASIHLIASLLLRRKKLSTQQEYEFPLIQMIELAVIAILGIMVIPDIILNYRLLMVLAACVAIILFSFFYDRRKRPKVHDEVLPVKRSRRHRRSDEFSISIKKATLRNVLSVMMVTLEIFEGTFFAVYLPLTSWGIFMINDVPVLTYGNFIVIILFVLGLLLVRDAGKRLKEIIGHHKP